MSTTNFIPYKNQDNDVKTCIICLDDDNTNVVHYSEFNNDCSCNYYVHETCIIKWIKHKPNSASCLLCSKPIMNANEIARVDTQQVTEYHPRRLRVMRMSMRDLLNNNTEMAQEHIIAVPQVQPIIIQDYGEEYEHEEISPADSSSSVTHLFRRQYRDFCLNLCMGFVVVGVFAWTYLFYLA